MGYGCFCGASMNPRVNVEGPRGPEGPQGPVGPEGPRGPAGSSTFVWGDQTVIWADSSAPGPGDGSPSDPYQSLQAAITAATSSAFANTLGTKARLVILIAANSAFDEDVIIPPARNVQLLGLGPWTLGNAILSDFVSTIPRNITIQTNPSIENAYLVRARSVTVIGTLDNGTSASTHTNYTDGATISGNIIFQNTDPIDGSTTIEFQLLNASVLGSIINDPLAVPAHTGITNTYIYHSRIRVMNKASIRIQRLVDSRLSGSINVAVYANVTNCFFQGNVTASLGSFLVNGDLPPLGIYNSQFDTITWNGTLALDASSNYSFVTSASVLVGVKTILNSLV